MEGVSTNLLTAVLQIPNKRFLDTVKLRELNIDGFASSFQILSAFSEVLTTLNSGGCNGERSLLRMKLVVEGS
jgi:hypothetical protein